jgi:hypothetical protein
METWRGAGYATVMSARSGETEDSWLADLARRPDQGRLDDALRAYGKVEPASCDRGGRGRWPELRRLRCP